MSLLIDQSIAQIETLLRDSISLSLKMRRVSVADIPALRAFGAAGASGGSTIETGDLAWVASVTNAYRWDQFSQAVDDGDLIVKPASAGTTGRWLKQVTKLLLNGVNAAQVSSGVVKQVILHNGDFDEDVLLARVYGLRPCVAIHFAGENHVPLSQIGGALYDYRVQFELWSVSSNYRDQNEGAVGSPIAAEAADDPGVMRIHGALKLALAGKSGEELGQKGIKTIEISSGELIEARYADRLFVMALHIEVRGSIHNADAPSELVQPTEIDVQRNIVQAPDDGGAFDDVQNVVTAGLDVPYQIGFFGTVNPGSCIVGGVPVAFVGELRTFPASSDTYRDMSSSGIWTYTSVPNDATPPAQAAGTLRVGVTVTDAAGIVADSFLCSVETPFPDANTPDVVPL